MKIAILGAGKLGVRVVEALVDGDNELTLVDIDEDKLNQISQQYDVFTVAGNVKSIDFLKSINVKSFDFLFSVTSSDDTNILSASFAKVLGCKKVAARVREPEHMAQFDFLREHYNIDVIVNPDNLIAGAIYKYLIEKYTLSSGIFTLEKIALIEVESSMMKKVIGKPLREFRSIVANMIVVGISRRGKVIIPHGNDVIEEKDILYIIGEKDEVFKLATTLRGKNRKSDAQNVMIVGGGNTGYYLAKHLSEYGTAVKLIERDRKRCHYLSNNLPGVLVLNGDGTDINFLQQEDIEAMDAFVTATGYDEENLLLALTAKNHGVEDVISKVSHESYKDLISMLGIDIVLNPLDITTSTILRAIRSNQRIVSSVLLQGQAELMEVFVTDQMGIVNSMIRDFNFPESIIIAAIMRGTETIIPHGNTPIMNGDRIIVVCQLADIGQVEKLFKSKAKINILK